MQVLLLVPYNSICNVQVNYEDICTALRCTTIQVTKSSQLGTLTNHMSHHLWGTLVWAESMTKVEDKVTKAIRAALESNKYDTPVLDAFNAVFEQSTLTPLKLKRFGSLRALLLLELLPARVAEAKRAAEPYINEMRLKALMQLNYENSNLVDTFQRLDSGIRGCIIQHVIAHIKNRPLNLPESFQLAEDTKVKKKRARLNNKLTQIITATAKIAHIEDAISVGSHTDHLPPSAEHDVPDVPDFAEQAYPEATHSSHAARLMTDELQMHAVPRQTPPASHHSSAAGAPSGSSHSTPVPVSVAAQVNSTAEHPHAPCIAASDSGASPTTPHAQTENFAVTNSNLACSMAQLGSLQLDSPGSAAGIEAETETVPLSPTASVAASVADSFVHIM